MNLAQRLARVRAFYGDWSAHNMELAPGVFTISPLASDRVLRRASLYASLACTFLKSRIKGLRVLDLGCLEGGVSLFLAQQGARCMGVDVRTAHLEKAKFAARELRLARQCQWLEGDVTSADLWKKLDHYDLIICSGLLYHLDAESIAPLLENLSAKCSSRGMVIIDTNISSAARQEVAIGGGQSLWGSWYHEHDPGSKQEERLAAGWSSFENDRSFWLTERSLVNALVMAGFGSVFKPLYPYHEWKHQMRDVWVALPGPVDLTEMPLRLDPDLRPMDHPGLG